MNELSVLKLFQLSNDDLLFSKHDYSLYKVRKPRMTKLGQGVGVRAHYPSEDTPKVNINFDLLF